MILRDYKLLITVRDILNKMDMDMGIFFQYDWTEISLNDGRRKPRRKVYSMKELIDSPLTGEIDYWSEHLIVEYISYDENLGGLRLKVSPLGEMKELLIDGIDGEDLLV